jgi:AbrB family looped-hinge helix DNA binding protein
MKARRSRWPEVFFTTISSKGQMVLPAEVRSRLGLRKGMRVSVSLGEQDDHRIVLRPLTPESVSKVRGSMKSAGAALDYLQEQRRKDRERGR